MCLKLVLISNKVGSSESKLSVLIHVVNLLRIKNVPNDDNPFDDWVFCKYFQKKTEVLCALVALKYLSELPNSKLLLFCKT